MRSARLARSLGVSLMGALTWGCGSAEQEGSGVEGGGTAGSGVGGTSTVGGVGIGGAASGSGGKANTGGTASNAGTNSGGAGGAAGAAGCMPLNSAEQTALFEQAPHCTMTFDYQLEGSIDGGVVHDTREAGFTGGYVNGNTGHFETPSANSPDATRVKIRVDWTRALAHGDSCVLMQGLVVPPTGNPRAGEELCITQGAVGFVQGGADDGNFKFHLYGARAGADCSGEEVPLDLRGCM